MPEQSAPRRAVFRTPGVAVLGALLLAVTATPFALSAPGLQLIYLVPTAFAVWVLRTRTVVDSNGIVVVTVFGKRVVPWSALTSLRLGTRARVRGVLADKTEVTLPAVRTRHLPVLALVSGGRLSDPTEADPSPSPETPSPESSSLEASSAPAAKADDEGDHDAGGTAP